MMGQKIKKRKKYARMSIATFFFNEKNIHLDMLTL